MVTAQRREGRGKEREVREAVLQRCLLLCRDAQKDAADDRNGRQCWENLQALQGGISSWGREMRRDSSSQFLLIVSCLRELMPPKTLQQAQRKPSLTPWSSWFTQFQGSGVGNTTSHKEIEKKASLGSWEGRWRFCPKGTATTHPQIHPCPPIINRPHHAYGASTLSVRKTDTEETEFIQWGFRFWLKAIKELRRAGVLGGTYNRVRLPGGSVVKDLTAMQQMRVWSLDQEDTLEKRMATPSRKQFYIIKWICKFICIESYY